MNNANRFTLQPKHHKAFKAMLHELCKELTCEYEWINWGGCAVMASIVGHELQRIGVTVDIVTPLYNESVRIACPANVRAKVNDPLDVYEWDNNGLHRGHLAVRFKLGKCLYTWDSDVFNRGGSTYGDHRQFDSKYPFGHGLTVAECGIISAKPKGWNTTYDRSQTPRLKTIVKAKFKAFVIAHSN